jgi:hypothetical protein
MAAMVRASTSGGEKAASLVPKALRAKRWRLSVELHLSVFAPPSSFASRNEPNPKAINAQPRCILVNCHGSKETHRSAQLRPPVFTSTVLLKRSKGISA